MTPPPRTGQSDSINYPIKNPGKIEGKMGPLSRKNAALLAGGVIVLALAFCRTAPPAAAQITDPTPTPLPYVIDKRNDASDANQKVNDLQAQRANVQGQLNEINRNIESQIAQAVQASADAKIAAASQNMVEFGAAIGRLEGALAQLKDSYAGKDSIIADLQTRIDTQAEQNATDKREIDRLALELKQEKVDKKMALDSYNAVVAQRQTSQQNDMVSGAVWIVAIVTFLLALMLFAAFKIQRRRDTVIEPPPAEHDVIDAEIVSAEIREDELQ